MNEPYRPPRNVDDSSPKLEPWNNAQRGWAVLFVLSAYLAIANLIDYFL